MKPKLLRRALVPAVLVAAIAAACSASGALAAGLTPITDCQAHGRLTQSYTVAQLEHALATMPADVKQYTDCQDVITTALNAALKTGKSPGSASSGSSGGSFLPTWLIVVIVILLLGAATFAAIAIRRRRSPGGGHGQGPATP
jgi:hypothetical protein